MSMFGARNRNRTGMALRPRDFKSLVSTNFTIRARTLVCLIAELYVTVTMEMRKIRHLPRWRYTKIDMVTGGITSRFTRSTP